MAGFKSYGTSIVLPPRYERFVQAAGVPRVWRADTADDPSGRFWCDDEGDLRLELFHEPDGGDPTHQLRPARQLLIHAYSETVVAEVLSMIHCGCLLAHPSWTEVKETDFVYEIGALDPASLRIGAIGDSFRLYEQADCGVLAAKAAWGDPGAEYALQKYKFSLGLDSITPQSAHPRHGDLFGTRYESARQHVGAAFAILAAFTAIEELGLEVRSSRENPRFVGDHKDEWNSKVLAKLEKRLCAAGIDPDISIQWLRRGHPTQVEREMLPKLGKRSEWSARYPVRDLEVRITDAIHYVSWLRNFVAAHKFRPLATAVSPYDVFNSQTVARRLLLHYLGLWDHMFARSAV